MPGQAVPLGPSLQVVGKKPTLPQCSAASAILCAPPSKRGALCMVMSCHVCVCAKRGCKSLASSGESESGVEWDSVSLLILGPWAQALGEIDSPLEALGPGLRGNRFALGGPWARH